MKKRVYTPLLIATYICGALLILAQLMPLAFDHELWRLKERSLLRIHITLLATNFLVLFAHYYLLVWGKKRGILKISSVNVLCVVDICFFGFVFLSAVVGFKVGMEKLVRLLTDPDIGYEDLCDLILRAVSFVIPSLRIVFTAYIRNGKSK